MNSNKCLLSFPESLKALPNSSVVVCRFLGANDFRVLLRAGPFASLLGPAWVQGSWVAVCRETVFWAGGRGTSLGGSHSN